MRRCLKPEHLSVSAAGQEHGPKPNIHSQTLQEVPSTRCSPAWCSLLQQHTAAGGLLLLLPAVSTLSFPASPAV